MIDGFEIAASIETTFQNHCRIIGNEPSNLPKVYMERVFFSEKRKSILTELCE